MESITAGKLFLIACVMFQIGVYLPIHYLDRHLKAGKTLSFMQGDAKRDESKKFILKLKLGFIFMMAIILSVVFMFNIGE